MFIKLFRSAGATGHVFTLSRGRSRDRGVGWSGWIGPATTVAVVPTVTQVINFSAEAYTSDNQSVLVSGAVQIRFAPAIAKEAFDFAVDPRNGGYQSEWETLLQESIAKTVLNPIRLNAAKCRITEAVTAQVSFETAVDEAIAGATNSLAVRGVKVEGCSVSLVRPTDLKVGGAIGATEREALLSQADNALHNRQLKAAQNNREVRTYDAETALALENERAKLVASQNENLIATAEAEAKATDVRLKPLANIPPPQLLAEALMRAAENGGLGQVVITTELLTHLSQTKSDGR